MRSCKKSESNKSKADKVKTEQKRIATLANGQNEKYHKPHNNAKNSINGKNTGLFHSNNLPLKDTIRITMV